MFRPVSNDILRNECRLTATFFITELLLLNGFRFVWSGNSRDDRCLDSFRSGIRSPSFSGFGWAVLGLCRAQQTFLRGFVGSNIVTVYRAVLLRRNQ
jgi:hypothetical protein